MTVELIYECGCPNIASARANLVRAFAASGRQARWNEWERNAPGSPAYVRDYASPTVLVDGKDVAEDGAGEIGASCRLYGNDAGQLNGAPPVALIAAALSARDGSAHNAEHGVAGWRSSLAATPGIAIAFLPKLACPTCWPIYTGLLSSLGIGFLWQQDYLLPLTAAFLLLALGALAFRARTRRGYGPLLLGLAAALAVLAGKFALDSHAVMYAGIAGLLAAALWNGWPLRISAGCPACLLEGPSPGHLEKGGERS